MGTPLKPPEPQAAIVFGASGDLTRRKLLPAFWHLFVEGLLPQGFAIVGYARSKMTTQEFQERARDSIREFAKTDPVGEEWEEFKKLLFYLPGEFESELAMEELCALLVTLDESRGTNGGRFFYCATPPMDYPLIVARIGESRMNPEARIVIEKPFGRDLESARELNAALHRVFDESQIFRIDHYLGKETVQNILAFRFANGIVEPIWNRRYVDNVQITVAEEIGIEGRGAFYEQTGALRDMVSTHLFQVLTFLAMEPPVSFEPNRLRDEKVKVLQAMQECSPERVVRGQYEGYRSEPDVAPDSTTETFVALELLIDSWRWAGVPFFLRTGKLLNRKLSETSLSFRDVPFNVFKGTDATVPQRDHLTFRVQPNEGILLDFNVKRPGLSMALEPAQLDFDYQTSFQAPLVDAYEVLLLEAMKGDHMLFTREDEVERAWEVLTPVLLDPPEVRPYRPGSWGPDEADALIAPRRWHVCPPPGQKHVPESE